MKHFLLGLLITCCVGLSCLLAAPVAMADPLQPGAKAPDFLMPATNNQQVSLQQYKGKYVVMVFYPMDNTPGCTVQLCSLRDTVKAFYAANTAILAVNAGGVASHQRFADRQDFPFPLASDSGSKTANAYGVNRSFGMANARTVFIISPFGKVIFSEEGMPTPETLLEAIKQHQKKNLSAIR